jgi:hypothetical protein
MRNVTLWPDADRRVAETETEAQKYGCNMGDVLPYRVQPGPMAMRKLGTLLTNMDCKVKIIDVGIDSNRGNGWDAADALQMGWDWDITVGWAKPRASLFTVSDVVNLENDQHQLKGTSATESTRITKRELWESLGLDCRAGFPIPNEDNVLRILERHKPFEKLVWYDKFHRRYFHYEKR